VPADLPGRGLIGKNLLRKSSCGGICEKAIIFPNYASEALMQCMTKSRSQFIEMTTILLLALLQSPARAQDWSDAAHEEAQQQNQNHVVVGLGAGYAPAYEGADKYRGLPVPAFDVKQGRLFVNLRNGVGINIVETPLLTVGTSVMFMPGYRRQDAPAGIGELSIGAGGRVFVSLRTGGLVATVGATKGVVGGTHGTVADASLSYPIAVAARFTLIPTIGTTWADAKYNDRYFGVDAQQSLASGLPQYAPGSGIKDASAILSANYRLTDNLSLAVSVGATSLLGNVKDSPIVFHRNAQPAGFLTVAYRLGH
jgi:MipA family protein